MSGQLDDTVIIARTKMRVDWLNGERKTGLEPGLDSSNLFFVVAESFDSLFSSLYICITYSHIVTLHLAKKNLSMFGNQLFKCF